MWHSCSLMQVNRDHWTILSYVILTFRNSGEYRLWCNDARCNKDPEAIDLSIFLWRVDLKNIKRQTALIFQKIHGLSATESLWYEKLVSKVNGNQYKREVFYHVKVDRDWDRARHDFYLTIQSCLISPRSRKTKDDDIKRVSNEQNLKYTQDTKILKFYDLSDRAFVKVETISSSICTRVNNDILVMQDTESNSRENFVNLRKSFPQFYLKNTCVIERQGNVSCLISEKRDRLFWSNICLFW